MFEKFGIDYCCDGKRPLAEACNAANLSVYRGIPVDKNQRFLLTEPMPSSIAFKQGTRADTACGPTFCRLPGISSGNVAFQLLNRLCLTRDDPLHEIANRHHSHDGITLDDGKMTKIIVVMLPSAIVRQPSRLALEC